MNRNLVGDADSAAPVSRRTTVAVSPRRRSFSSAAFAALALGAGCLLSTTPAVAQPPSAAASPLASASVAPPGRLDVVKLKNGSMFRGVILELVPNDHVEIRLATGAVKRFPMNSVTFAGASEEAEPAPAAPPPAPPPPPPAPPKHEAPPPPQVQFDSDTPDTTLYVKDGETIGSGLVSTGRGVGTMTLRAKSYSRICSAPCDSTLENGTYQLAVAKGNGSPVESEESVTIDGPSSVTAKYIDNSSFRTAGGVVMVATGLAAAVMTVKAFGSQEHCTDVGCGSVGTLNGGLLGGAFAVAGLGSLVGIVLVLQHDGVTFSVTPWNGSTAALAPIGGASREHARATPEGLALHVQF